MLSEYKCTAAVVVHCHAVCVAMPVPSVSIVSLPSLHVQWGNTPFLRAAQEGHAEVALCLLENGSCVQEQNNVSKECNTLCACEYKVGHKRYKTWREYGDCTSNAFTGMSVHCSVVVTSSHFDWICSITYVHCRVFQHHYVFIMNWTDVMQLSLKHTYLLM